MENLLHDFLECVETLQKELTFQASQGEKWVLGFDVCEDFQDQKSKAVPFKIIPPASPPEKASSTKPELKKAPILFPSSFQKSSPIVFVRLCPSPAELESGKPYSDEGAALLEKIIAAMKWNPEDVHKTYLCPSAPDQFSEEQFRECTEKLVAQMCSIRPKILIAWGERVSQILSGIRGNIEKLHEKFIPHPQGFVLMPSWDPIYLIKRPEYKKTVWDDLQKIAQYLK